MTDVILDVSMSLDGYIAGPNRTVEQPSGEGNEHLYHWLYQGTDLDRGFGAEMMAGTGAVVMGRRTFDMSLEKAWSGSNPFTSPVFVVSHRDPGRTFEGFSFVTDGLESALERARSIAGDKHVWVMGGASIAQQCLQLGLVDELHVHLAPALLGAGVRLFEAIDHPIVLENRKSVQTPSATHLQFRVVR